MKYLLICHLLNEEKNKGNKSNIMGIRTLGTNTASLALMPLGRCNTLTNVLIILL